MGGRLAQAMPRPPTGTIDTHDHADGRTTTVRIRVRYQGERHTLILGTNHQGWNRERAQTELDRIMGQIERGTWEPPRKRARSEPVAGESMHEFASRWWHEHQHEWKPKTRDDYKWRLDHLLRHLHREPVHAIDRRTVDRLRATLGAAMSPRSANMVLSLLARLLDDAVDYKLIDSNPARGRRTRLKQPKQQRNFLEPDMVRDLLDAAGQLEAQARPADRYGRRALLATLCLAGPRTEEPLHANRGHVDVHAGLWRIPDSKTEAGIRTVELTFMLADEIREHLAAMKLAGRPAHPGAPLFPTRTGHRQNASNLRNRLLVKAIDLANEKRAEQGRMEIPENVTPRTLRRTFIGMSLLAGRDPRWVMSQVGHEDARLTLSVYAQVMSRQRVDEALVWQLMRFPDEPDQKGFGSGNGSAARNASAQPRNLTTGHGRQNASPERGSG